MQPQELQIKIGKEIKKLRTLNSWTQDHVAGQLHICRNAYSDIELGKTDINISRLLKIADFYGVDVDYFLDGKEKAVFYLSGTQNTQFHNSHCNEYHLNSEQEKQLQHELEKAQLTISHLRQELADKQKIIELLENQAKNGAIHDTD